MFCLSRVGGAKILIRGNPRDAKIVSGIVEEAPAVRQLDYDPVRIVPLVLFSFLPLAKSRVRSGENVWKCERSRSRDIEIFVKRPACMRVSLRLCRLILARCREGREAD